MRKAELFRQQKRLAGADHGNRQQHIVAGLGRLPRAGGAAMHDGAAHRLQHRPGGFHRGILAPHHEGERGIRSPHHPARDRGIQHGLAHRRRHLARRRHIDGRAIDEDGIRPRRRRQPAEPDLTHMPAGRQHGDHHIGARRHAGGIGRQPAAGRLQPDHGVRAEVEAHNLMPGAAEIHRHRQPHIAQTHKAYACHHQPPISRRMSSLCSPSAGAGPS